jgi:hypothetical protein
MAKPQKEYLYTADQWKAALKKVGVSGNDIIKAHTILVNDDIKQIEEQLKKFKWSLQGSKG